MHSGRNIAILFAAAGSLCLAGCPRLFGVRKPVEPAAPLVFGEELPTLEQVAQVVNANTRQVQSLQAPSASVRAAGYPALRGTFALEGERRFRLRAGTSFTGAEVDVGSNDSMFWVWIKRGSPPAVYYAGHDEFEQSTTRRMLPVSPTWLTEAMGLLTFDPRHEHTGPFHRPGDELEVRSMIPSATGDLIRVVTIDSRYGWVLRQQIMSPQGTLLAASRSFDHFYDPIAKVSLPRRTEIEIPAAQINLTVEAPHLIVNRGVSGADELWSMPRLENHRYVNLARPMAPAGASPPPPQANVHDPRGRNGRRRAGPSGMRRLPAVSARHFP